MTNEVGDERFSTHGYSYCRGRKETRVDIYLPFTVAGMGSTQYTCDETRLFLPEVSGNGNCLPVTCPQTPIPIGIVPFLVMEDRHASLLNFGFPDPILMASMASNPLLHPTNTARNLLPLAIEDCCSLRV